MSLRTSVPARRSFLATLALLAAGLTVVFGAAFGPAVFATDEPHALPPALLDPPVADASEVVGAGRRMFLGRAGRVPARARRDQRGVRLCRRREAARRSYETVGNWHDGPRRIGAGHLRSAQDQLRRASCRSISPSRTIRPSSTARAPTSARNTARRSSRRAPRRPRSPRPISPSSIRRMSSTRRSSPRSSPDKTFYPAEGYHQDFLARNPSHPYIVINDLPKIENLKRLLPEALSRRAGAGAEASAKAGWRPGLESNQALKTLHGFCVATPPPGQAQQIGHRD